jgi:hypothetical protein
MYYTGIGSRETPTNVCKEMTGIARVLESFGYTLRSGGAGGADEAFEKGADNAEIFLPWDGFRGRYIDHKRFLIWIPEAKKIAATIRKDFKEMGSRSKRFHTRNVHQVLGQDLNTPSKFLICWTKDGKPSGGTATAMKLARRHKIPVINLHNEPFPLHRFINI